jgi:F1F0 ATPase subunit 2
MMTLELVITFFIGFVIGMMFFGGLWWTVQKIVSSRKPMIWFLSGWLLRMILALTGFYFVLNFSSGTPWKSLLICLFGFILARPFVTWLTQGRQAHHAP